MEEAIALDSIQAIAASFGASFSAEKIVDTTVEKEGTRYYKVRWVKYSWEPAASFAHLEHLIQEFWSHYEQTHGPVHSIAGKSDGDAAKAGISALTTTPLLQSDGAFQTGVPAVVHAVGVHSSQSPVAQISAAQLPSLAVFPSLSPFGHLTVTAQEVQGCAQDGDSSLILEHGAIAAKDPEAVSRERKHRDVSASKKRRKIPGACNICGKQFKSTTNIAAHRKLHTEERQFECQDCGRKFRRRLHLRRHAESHAGVKNFVCEICGSAFTSKWYKEAHAVIHTGEQPYECEHCEKRFNNKANLNKHVLIHANKRPYVCNVCGQSYRQSYDLKRHMAIHSQAKDFVCPHCSKEFARKTYLTRHLLTHKVDKKYHCEVCDRSFFHRGHFNFHMKQKHPQDFSSEKDGSRCGDVLKTDQIVFDGTPVPPLTENETFGDVSKPLVENALAECSDACRVPAEQICCTREDDVRIPSGPIFFRSSSGIVDPSPRTPSDGSSPLHHAVQLCSSLFASKEADARAGAVGDVLVSGRGEVLMVTRNDGIGCAEPMARSLAEMNGTEVDSDVGLDRAANFVNLESRMSLASVSPNLSKELSQSYRKLRKKMIPDGVEEGEILSFNQSTHEPRLYMN